MIAPRDDAGVACCHVCSARLEIACPNGHDPLPITIDRRPVPLRVAARPRRYKTKTCACGAEFTPTGPRDGRCPACRGKTP